MLTGPAAHPLAQGPSRTSKWRARERHGTTSVHHGSGAPGFGNGGWEGDGWGVCECGGGGGGGGVWVWVWVWVGVGVGVWVLVVVVVEGGVGGWRGGEEGVKAGVVVVVLACVDRRARLRPACCKHAVNYKGYTSVHPLRSD